jgi:hypothetical protein
MRRLAEYISEGDRNRKASVDGLRDEVAPLEGSVEELAEKLGKGVQEEGTAEKERKMDVRMKLVESEADGLKHTVKVIEKESGGIKDGPAAGRKNRRFGRSVIERAWTVPFNFHRGAVRAGVCNGEARRGDWS